MKEKPVTGGDQPAAGWIRHGRSDLETERLEWRSEPLVLEGRRKGGCSAPHAVDPVSIPHDIEKQGVTTGTDPEPNPQVNGLIPLLPQVTGSARLNLSRWRHGFEPRWDYQRKRPCVVSQLGQISGAIDDVVPVTALRSSELVVDGLPAHPEFPAEIPHLVAGFQHLANHGCSSAPAGSFSLTRRREHDFIDAEVRGNEMRRAVGYVSVVLGWFVLVTAVALGVGAAWALIHDFGDVNLWRAALIVLILVTCGMAAYFLIRWARSAVGTPGGSRPGRLVLGLVLLALGLLRINHDPGPDAIPTVKDVSHGMAAGLALFGAALIFEVWWHRPSRISARPTLPNAPTPRSDSTAPSGIALPEPPPKSKTQ